MKRILLSLVTVFAITTIMACKSSSDSPSKAAVDFSNAMLKDDFAGAKKFVTTESQSMMDQGENMSKANPMPDSIKTIIEGAKITTANEKIVNDSTATVDVTTTVSKEIMGKKANTETIVLKKEAGAWKVDMIGTVKKAMESAGMPMEGADSSMQGMDTSGMASMPTDSVPAK